MVRNFFVVSNLLMGTFLFSGCMAGHFNAFQSTDLTCAKVGDSIFDKSLTDIQRNAYWRTDFKDKRVSWVLSLNEIRNMRATKGSNPIFGDAHELTFSCGDYLITGNYYAHDFQLMNLRKNSVYRVNGPLRGFDSELYGKILRIDISEIKEVK